MELNRRRREDISQNTKEWETLRKGKIGASDMPSAFGYGYDGKNLTSLLMDKIVGKNPIYSTNFSSMKAGSEMEEVMRIEANKHHKKEFLPEVWQVRDCALASLDGFYQPTKEILELKLCNKVMFANIKRSKMLPVHFYIQIQFQLFVTEANSASCFCYDYTYSSTKWATSTYNKGETIQVLPDLELWETFEEFLHLFEKLSFDVKGIGDVDIPEELGITVHQSKDDLMSKLCKIIRSKNSIYETMMKLLSDAERKSSYISKSRILIETAMTRSRANLDESAEEILKKYLVTKDKYNEAYEKFNALKEEQTLARNALFCKELYFMDISGVEKTSYIGSTHYLSMITVSSEDYKGTLEAIKRDHPYVNFKMKMKSYNKTSVKVLTKKQLEIRSQQGSSYGIELRPSVEIRPSVEFKARTESPPRIT